MCYLLHTSSSSILRIMTTWHKTPLISRQRAWQYQLLFVIVYIFLFCWENIIEPKLRRVTKCKLRHTVILIWSWETEFSLLLNSLQRFNTLVRSDFRSIAFLIRIILLNLHWVSAREDLFLAISFTSHCSVQTWSKKWFFTIFSKNY